MQRFVKHITLELLYIKFNIYMHGMMWAMEKKEVAWFEKLELEHF